MGVIYKLKDEVINFILDQKKEYPRLSCRKLVAIVQDRFQIQVSKSSINDIIKKAQMSSPVGRPLGGPAKTSAFKIPAEKKKNLFAESSGAPPQKKFQETAENDEIPSRKAGSAKKAGNKPPGTHKAVSDATPKKLGIKQQAVDEKVNISVNQENIYDCMGSIFLKAAQWSISEESLFGKILKKYSKNTLLKDVDGAFEILLYLKIFGIEKIEDLGKYDKGGLWLLNGSGKKWNSEILMWCMNQFQSDPKFALESFNEIEQLIFELASIRVFLENGEEFSIDSQFRSVYPNNVQSVYTYPFQKSINLVLNRLINNVQSVIIKYLPNKLEPSREFFNLWDSFNDVQNKRIKKIALFDSNNEEIINYAYIPKKKRKVIIGLWPGQDLFSKYLKFFKSTGNNASVITSPIIEGDKYHVGECTVNLHNIGTNAADCKVRLVLLIHYLSGQPSIILLTNNDQSLAQEIGLEYLQNWPNLSQTIDKKSDMEFSQIILKNSLNREKFIYSVNNYSHSTYDKIITLYLNTYELYCKKYFFSNKAYMDMNLIYSLGGNHIAGNKLIRIKLLPQGNFQYHNELADAVRLFNEHLVKNPENQRIVLDYA